MAVAVAAVHVLVFPWPLQGHINTFVPFSNALLDSGVHVTFLHTEHNLRRVRCAAAASPRLRYTSIPDGLPADHPRSVGDIKALMDSMWTTGAAAYRALLLSLVSSQTTTNGGGGGELFPPVTCVVADGIMMFAVDIAEELGVPALAFRTASANSFSAYLAVPGLLERGETPLPVDDPVRAVPGMEDFLRRRDLPRLAPAAADGGKPTTESETTTVPVAGGVHPFFLTVAKGIADCGRARALVLNTAASLEGPALSHISRHMRDVFAIGPLHAMPPSSVAPPAAGSLWREDDGCVAWLDGHADRSVVYVSLGSLTHISRGEFTEFLLGLLATGHPFLWVLRPDMAVGAAEKEALRRAVGDGSKVRVVGWAPQRDVLRHRAVGCFLTHSGWNSTMESILEGVPMVCWPFFADQHINSRFVEAVWGAGLDMKDVCDRDTVRSMVTEVMESGEMRRSVRALAQRVQRDVATGGSSETELKRLVGFITELSTMDRNEAAKSTG